MRGDGVRVVDLSELIRVWGEPERLPEQTQRETQQMELDTQQAMLQELQAMRRELKALREEVAQLRSLPAPPATTGEGKETLESNSRSLFKDLVDELRNEKT